MAKSQDTNHITRSGFSSASPLLRWPKQHPLVFKIVQWLLACLLIGLLVGSASALFLVSLDAATHLREANLWLLWGLPVAGFLTVTIYDRYGKGSGAGNALIFDRIYRHGPRIPLRMTWLVLGGTLITHLFGGSAGREGTALQMGASLGDQLYKPLSLRKRHRSLLLQASMAAGFGSVFGTPWAGAFFALEVAQPGRFHFRRVLPILLASFFAHWVTTAWGVVHTHYLQLVHVPFSVSTLAMLAVTAACFGLVGKLFVWCTESWKHLLSRWFHYAPWRASLAGMLVLVSTLALGTTDYIGLGIPMIERSFVVRMALYGWLLKMLLTAITVGGGFKGGEVTPLFFIGATLGSAMSAFLPLPIALLASVGFVAVFASIANVPLACTVMAMELFGPAAGAPALLCCTIAYLVAGRSSLYNTPAGYRLFEAVWTRVNGTQ